MRTPDQLLSRLLSRWSKQQETALGKLSEGETMRQRLAGFGKSERLDAKFLLLAMAPFIPAIASDQFGWERGNLWHAWFVISSIWAIIIFGIGTAPYVRALRRAMRRKQ